MPKDYLKNYIYVKFNLVDLQKGLKCGVLIKNVTVKKEPRLLSFKQ